MRHALTACIAAVAVGLAVPAAAQDFPKQLIKIVIPFTPGGSNDVVGRELAAGFQTRWSSGAVVENRPGGGRHHCVFSGGEIAIRRSPAADRAGVIHDRAAHVAQSAVQPDCRLCADQHGGRRSVRHGHASERSRAQPEGVCRAGEGKAGADELRLGRRRHAAASRRRVVQAERRRRSGACAVPRRDCRSAGPLGRPRPCVHRCDQFALAADQGRQARRARRSHSQAHPVATGCSGACGDVSGLRCRFRRGPRRAGRQRRRRSSTSSTAPAPRSSPPRASAIVWRRSAWRWWARRRPSTPS